MIHKIVNQALKEMEPFHIPRQEERYEMVYCLGRLESTHGYERALEILKEHLPKHYRLKTIKEYGMGDMFKVGL